MKLYKSPDGVITGYADDGSQDYLIPSNYIKLSSAEVFDWGSKAQKDQCKEQAKALLSQSDWSVLPDVGLKNSAVFVAYRGILRGLVIDPQINPDFPVEPVPVWE